MHRHIYCLVALDDRPAAVRSAFPWQLDGVVTPSSQHRKWFDGGRQLRLPAIRLFATRLRLIFVSCARFPSHELYTITYPSSLALLKGQLKCHAFFSCYLAAAIDGRAEIYCCVISILGHDRMITVAVDGLMLVTMIKGTAARLSSLISLPADKQDWFEASNRKWH